MSKIALRDGSFYDLQNPVCPSMNVLAWGVAHTPRFMGQSSRFYSVAEHLLNGIPTASKGPEGSLLAWLLHDLHEALVGDVPTPYKRFWPGFQKAEADAARVVRERYGYWLSEDAWAWAKTLDADLLSGEVDALGFDSEQPEWDFLSPFPEPLGYRYGLSPLNAYATLLENLPYDGPSGFYWAGELIPYGGPDG